MNELKAVLKLVHTQDKVVPRSNSETQGTFCDGLGSNIVVRCPVGPIITHLGRITARECVDRWGNQVHPMNETLFLNNDAVFQDESGPTHIAGTVQSWFEEHEGYLQHFPWPTHSPDLNNIEPLWSVLETRVRNSYPPPIFLKQLEESFQKEWYKIPLDTVQNLYEAIQRKNAAS
jgi:hypothetical protein